MSKSRMRWSGHAACVEGEEETCIQNYGHKTEVKRQENYIKFYLQATKLEGVDFTHLVPEKEKWWTLVKIIMNLQVP
jgi:hypothetical protein